MGNRQNTIQAFVKLGEFFVSDTGELQAVIAESCVHNLWFSPENYRKALKAWSEQLNPKKLNHFSAGYQYAEKPKNIGIVMAGNIPMVGFHDLFCVLLSGHHALIKPASDDKKIWPLILNKLAEFEPELQKQIQLTDRLTSEIDAVIATGSNNTFRYFEYYFNKIPHLLRKNRKSLAILKGNESPHELEELSKDIFSYFGLGCRNVSLVFIPEGMPVTRLIDAFELQKEIIYHNRYANNYTYHKALFLMNQQTHLDNGFVLLKEERSLKAPLSCLYYSYYKNTTEIDEFISYNEQDIQCVVGNYSGKHIVPFGLTQSPDIKDFADKKDSMLFLTSL